MEDKSLTVGFHFKVPSKKIGKSIREILGEHIQHETPTSAIASVPTNWEGFKNGDILKILRSFGKGVYVALEYFVSEGNVIVNSYTDDVPPDSIEVVIDGVKGNKYTKKSLQIIKILDKENSRYEVKRYRLDLTHSEPVIKVLDVYSSGEGGLPLPEFTLEENY